MLLLRGEAANGRWGKYLKIGPRQGHHIVRLLLLNLISQVQSRHGKMVALGPSFRGFHWHGAVPIIIPGDFGKGLHVVGIPKTGRGSERRRVSPPPPSLFFSPSLSFSTSSLSFTTFFSKPIYYLLHLGKTPRLEKTADLKA